MLPLLNEVFVNNHLNDAREGEDREQCDDVREPFVKASLLRRGRVGVAPAQAVEEGVRRLVDDHVVREAGEDQAGAEAARLPALRLPFRRVVVGVIFCLPAALSPVEIRLREVAEQQRAVVLRIEGIGVGEGVRRDLKLVAEEAPADAPPEG